MKGKIFLTIEQKSSFCWTGIFVIPTFRNLCNSYFGAGRRQTRGGAPIGSRIFLSWKFQCVSLIIFYLLFDELVYIGSMITWGRSKARDYNTLCGLYWSDSGWWRYRLMLLFIFSSKISQDCAWNQLWQEIWGKSFHLTITNNGSIATTKQPGRAKTYVKRKK